MAQVKAPMTVVLTMVKKFQEIALASRIGKIDSLGGIDKGLDIGSINDSIDREKADEFDRETVQPWTSECGYDPGSPEENFLRGLLYKGISEEILGKHDLHHPDLILGFWTGSKSQLLLCDALGRATPELRQALVEESRHLQQWQFTKACVGALAALRTFTALRSLSGTIGVRLGTLYEDLILGTDIVVTGWRNSRGLVVQVKCPAPKVPQGAFLIQPGSPRPSFGILPPTHQSESNLKAASRLWQEVYRRGTSDRHKPWYGLLVYAQVDNLPATELFDQGLVNLLRPSLESTGFVAANAA